MAPVSDSLHGTCVAREGEGVLLLGPAGAGKSDLALRLIGIGFALVADDRVIVRDGVASAPPSLAGLLEVRGLGVIRLRHEAAARLRLVVELMPGERLPAPARDGRFGVPRVRVEAGAASAAARVALALDCALGRVESVAGAFA